MLPVKILKSQHEALVTKVKVHPQGKNCHIKKIGHAGENEHACLPDIY